MLDKEILREPQHTSGTVSQGIPPSPTNDSGIPNHEVLVEGVFGMFERFCWTILRGMGGKP